MAKLLHSFLSLPIVVTSCLLAVHDISAQNWTYKNMGQVTVLTIKAVDENVVWAGGGNGVFLRTTDGGANWTSGMVPESVDITSIVAIDVNTAYYAGAGNIYKTTDGGANWDLQYQYDAAPCWWATSIAFWDEMHGIGVCGSPFDEGFVVFTTENGGADWVPIPTENIPPSLTREFVDHNPPSAGAFLTVAGSSHAWFGTSTLCPDFDPNCKPLRVFRSTDRGQTWTVSDTELPTECCFYQGITSIVFKDTLNGFVGSFDGYGAGNTLARTTDGGQTWTNVSNFVALQTQVNSIVYVPETDFQAILVATDGGPVYSNDGGATWAHIRKDRFLRFTDISFASPTAGWGANGSGTIAKYNGVPLTPVAVERLSEVPQDFGLSQNFPNPFSASTRIRFTLERRASVRLSVFDMLGIEVAVPVNEELGPGDHEAVFEAGSLPSGVYFYRIQAGAYMESQKLTIVR